MASTASAEQSISCTAGCSVAPTPSSGSPESSAVTWSTTTSGGIAWANGTWDVTLPFVAGDQFTKVTATGVQDTSTCNVVMNLKSSIGGSLGNNASSGSGAAGQTVAISLSTPYTVQSNETVWVQLIPLCGGALPHVNTLNSTVGAVTVATPPGPQPQAGVFRTMQYPIDLGTVTTWQDHQTLGVGGAKLVTTIGDQILAVRARIQDTTTTKLAVALQRMTEDVATTVATSPQSLGNGAKQTLSVSGLTEVAASGQTYQVVIQRPVGSDNCSSWWIEVDLQ